MENKPKKILVVDYPSFIEQSVHNLECTAAIYDADIIVNPTYGSVIGRTIIVNLPISVPLDQLKDHNKIISRFPISSDIEVQLFPLPTNRSEVTIDEMSCIILSKDIVNDPRYIELVHCSKFLVGTSEICDNAITAVGYILLRNKIENL
jgi:hypothetical protein